MTFLDDSLAKKLLFLPEAPEPAGPLEVQLGFTHLNASGLSRGWLLREAAHLHCMHLGQTLHRPLSTLRDTDGKPVLVCMTDCTIQGDTGAFYLDDNVILRQTLAPSAASGWRSESLLVGPDGKTLKVEMVSRFLKRRDTSNRFLLAAQIEGDKPQENTSHQSRRTDTLRALGAADLGTPEARYRLPQVSTRIDKALHLDGSGLTSFAALHDLVENCENHVLPDTIANHMPMVHRRAHLFGNIDPGDSFEIATQTQITNFAASGHVRVISIGRRAQDGKTIVSAESHYRM